MKNKLINFAYFLLLLILPILSCREKISSPDAQFTLKGKVIYNNSALAGAQVNLDSTANYSAVTDAEGNFSISNVSEGAHKLTVYKSLPDSNFTEINKSVTVNSDLELSDLLLPKAVFLYPLTNVTSSSIVLTWSPTDAADFREYKVYRHTTRGLDETTSTLVYVATTIHDTSFTDTELFESTQYYYRIFVMNEYGKLGGSNIESSKTPDKNLIKNGDFESFDNFNKPTDWITENNVWSVSNQKFQSGGYGLRGEVNSYLYEIGGASLRQYIPYTSLVTGKQYTFSFFYNIENLDGNSALKVSLGTNIQTGSSSIISTFIDNTAPSGWQKFSFAFTAPQLTEDLVISCYVNVNIPYNNELWLMWLDNFELERAE